MTLREKRLLSERAYKLFADENTDPHVCLVVTFQERGEFTRLALSPDASDAYFARAMDQLVAEGTVSNATWT